MVAKLDSQVHSRVQLTEDNGYFYVIWQRQETKKIIFARSARTLQFKAPRERGPAARKWTEDMRDNVVEKQIVIYGKLMTRMAAGRYNLLLGYAVRRTDLWILLKEQHDIETREFDIEAVRTKDWKANTALSKPVQITIREKHMNPERSKN
jgi:hypothetical protein